MKSDLKWLFSGLVAFALIPLDSPASQAANPFPQSGAGVIVAGQAHSLARAFFGANIDGAYNPTGTYQWTDPRTLAAVKALNLQSLRYPGGTDANYWDWHTGWVYPSFPTGAGPFSETLKDFAPLVKLTGPPIFDLNVMTYNNAIATPAQTSAMVQDQIAMLKAAQQLGMPVEYIELGNELYFALRPMGNKDASYYAQRFTSGAPYVNEMNYWIKELKSAFPQAQIAVLGQAFQGGTWNVDLLSNLSGADAVTLHYYHTQEAGGEDPMSILSKAVSKWTWWRPAEIQPLAAKGMSAWITEFDFIDHTSDLEYTNTWLHGLFDAQMLVQFLSDPVITTVDIYNVHSQSKRSSLVYDGTEKFGPHGAIGAQAGALSASGQVVSIFGQALNGASAAAPIQVSGLAPVSSSPSGAKFTPFPPVSGVALSYGATGGMGLILLNLSPQPITLSYGGGTAQIQSVSAPSLSTNVVTATSLGLNTRQISLRQFEIPAFSVNYVRR
jgi:hypothetical protein